ncbi:hypothetical protein RhiXN_07700 [Rhizoctonia solani]|uniref:Uncharacterized protein n=1 Tax=Rhizoctonia solani TaxID=456999 RepID=A0A8H8SYM3_9AGAM|nr:uncharacterized protein RhiXN_07700 [Rhizoctonia solani]QRW22664.1 hypothetical protein RhiXN_07700 [Rhizoctonia solani]
MKFHHKLFSWANNTKPSSQPYSKVLKKDGVTTATRSDVAHEWFHTVRALILHCVLSVFITLYMVCYISGNYFNTQGHAVLVQNAEGFQLPFTLTQSDAVTILSSLIVIQKWALTAWVAPLCWRIAVLLMERHGLRRRDLKALIGYRLLTPHTFLKNVPTFIIGTLLLAGLVANLVSPVLTGSISWTQSRVYLTNSNISSIELIDAGKNESIPSWYFDEDEKLTRDGMAQKAVGLASLTWRRGSPTDDYRRISNSVELLKEHDTVERVILPYFKVHSIDWITDKKDVPGHVYRKDGKIDFDEPFHSGPCSVHLYYVGTVALLNNPNHPTDWSNDPMEPQQIKDKRLLIFWFGQGAINVTGGLPHNVYVDTYIDSKTQISHHYAYAWVKFTAGAGKCTEYRCTMGSPPVIRHADPKKIRSEKHLFTFQALHMAPAVATILVSQNSTVPSSWTDPKKYITAVLKRSYSAAWNIIMEEIGQSTVKSNYRTFRRSLVASVDTSRVYSWLGIQLSITFLSIVFLILQSRLSAIPLVGDASLTAFYLDTTSLPESDCVHSLIDGALVVHEEGDRLRIKVDEEL